MAKQLSIEALEARTYHLRQAGQPRQAMKVIDQIFRREKNNLNALFEAVLVQLDLKRPDLAVKYGKCLTRLAPETESAWVNLGAAYIGCGKRTRAIECYRRELERYPDSEPANFNLGSIFYKCRRWEKSLHHYWVCVIRRYCFSELKNAVAHCLEKLGRTDEEIAFYERCLMEDPRDAWAHHNLGAALMDVGNERRALIQLRIAQRKGYIDPCLSRNLKRLEKFRQSLLNKPAVDEGLVA